MIEPLSSNRKTNMDFEPLHQYLESLHERYGIQVYGCSVHLNGSTVFRAGNDTSTGLDFFHLYSATKPLTGFCAMQLIEQGKLGLYDRVSDYLPAFRHMTVANGKQLQAIQTPLRIHHLLSMSGGFDYDDDFAQMHALLDGNGQVRCADAVSLLAQRPLHFEPGTHYMYGLGLDILGAIIEKISGISLDTYMEQHIFRPIGSRNLTFTPDDTQIARMPLQQYRNGIGPEKDNLFLHARHFPSGGCGLCGTVDDYMLFLDMLANDGVSASGTRLLERETMNLFRTPMLAQQAQAELLRARAEPELQGLGVRVRPIPPLRGMYACDGAAGAYGFASKESKVSFFFATHLIHEPEMYTHVHPTLFRLACTALGDRIFDRCDLPKNRIYSI